MNKKAAEDLQPGDCVQFERASLIVEKISKGNPLSGGERSILIDWRQGGFSEVRASKRLEIMA